MGDDRKRETGDPRRLLIQPIAVVHASLADGPIDRRVEPLSDDDRVHEPDPLQGRDTAPREAPLEGGLEVDDIEIYSNKDNEMGRKEEEVK